MDLVNIVYRYVNRLINSDELINLMENLDKEKFSEDEVADITELLDNIKKLKNIKIEIDQVEQHCQSMINRILFGLEEVKDNKDKASKFLCNIYNNLEKSKHKVRDSGPRYEKISKLLLNDSVYIKYFHKMNDLELLEFITQYIYMPNTPYMTKEEFDSLVMVGIKDDKRESLWRLAVNYSLKGMDFSYIVDYFIEMKDVYYLVELISAVREDLDMDKLIMKIVNTNDKIFIDKLLAYSNNINLFNKEEIKKLTGKSN